MESWWTEIDGEILSCLEHRGSMSPDEIAHELGISLGEVTAFVSMLAREGKVRIARVELAEAPALACPA
jgi:DNA-binding Lrp family transcriptional regulator